MFDIINFVENYRELIIGLALITYAVVFYTFVRRIKVARLINKNQFFKSLKQALATETIVDVSDVFNIYKGIRRFNADENFNNGLNLWLREFLIYLYDDRDINPDDLRKYKKLISQFIADNEKLSPYADLPLNEKNIFTDINNFLNSGDIESVHRKLVELSTSVLSRQDDLTKIQNASKYSNIFAVIGFVLTIVFGILSL